MKYATRGILFAAILITSLIVALPALAGDEIRDINRTFELEGQTSVRLDLPVAEVRIEGSRSSSIEAEFTAVCNRHRECAEILDAIRLEEHGSRSTLRIDLIGYPKWGKGRVELEGVVRIPRSIDLEVELGVGEIEIKDHEGDLRVELGVGEINAWIEKAKTRSVTLDAGVGEVELYGADTRLEGRRSMLVGSETHWDEGPGDARVFLEVGVGEVSVWME